MKPISIKIRFYLPGLVLLVLLLVIAFGVSRYYRMHAYDELIAKSAAHHGLDARLIRSVIWRESAFRYNCRGTHGEIGLMQVTEGAAREWAEANGIGNLKKNDLFNPETNIEAGSWYLQRALARWSHKTNPVPYALAEYNAGRSNAVRWAANDGGDPNKFWNGISYRSTRQYVRDILTYYRRNSARR
jgi:soluble lytic murein transglycosylase